MTPAPHEVDRFAAPHAGKVLGFAGAVTIAYFLAAQLGLALRAQPSDVAVFWPASGIAASILILLGRRAYPALVIGVVAGTVAANLLSERGLWTSIFNGFCNAGEAVLVAWLLERWFGRPFTFGDVPRVVGFLAAACIAAAASAVGGAMTLTSLHNSAPFWDVWRTWFLSDGVGIVVTAPLVIGLGQVWRELPSRRELIEGAGGLALLALTSIYVVTHPTESWLSFSPGAQALPLLLWLAARCPPAFAVAGAFVASGTVICATTFGIGRFGDAAIPTSERVQGAQAVVVAVMVYTLILVALFAERRKAEEDFRESERRLAKKSVALARLHEASTLLWLKRDLRQGLDEILAGAVDLLGADMGNIQVLDGAKGVLTIAAHRGFKQDFLNVFREVSAMDGTACGRALLSGERIVIEDVETDALFAPFRSIARAADFRAVQSTPIISREGALLGILSTHFRAVHRPIEEDLRLLDFYVRQAAAIIERHQTDAALRESEERLRLAQLRTGIGVWDWDLRTGKLSRTPQLDTIFGIEPGRVTCYADFRELVHPDDIEAVEAGRDAAVRRREVFNIEFRIIRPDGQVRWLSAAGGAFYDEATGEPVRILGNNVDITERKLAELALAERNLQLALAGKAGLVGSYAYDADTEMMHVSEGYAAIHGYPEGTAEIARSKWLAGVHPEDTERIEVLRGEAFRERRREYQVEYRIIRAGGEIRWVEARNIISYSSDGRPQRVVGVNIDITDLKRAEEHQNLLIAELDHRVKNVLANVAVVARRTSDRSSSASDFIETLDHRLQSMAEAHALLSRSHWQGVNLATLIAQALAPYATAGNTLVEGPQVDLSAAATQAMAMVLHELATNAAKHGALSAPQGRVSVRWQHQADEGASAMLRFEWHEQDSPVVTAPDQTGYGISVIRDLIPYELDGTVDLTFGSGGVRCSVAIPAEHIIQRSASPLRSSIRTPHPTSHLS